MPTRIATPSTVHQRAARKASAPRVKQRIVRKALVDSAIELFAARGFDAVTVAEIADQVGIARRTFFLYFATKEDVLTEWMDAEWQRATDILLERHASLPPFEAYAAALMELADHCDAHREQSLAVTQIIMSHPTLFGRQYAKQFEWEKRWAEELRKAQKKTTSQALEYETQAAAAFAVVAVVARRWCQDAKRQTFAAWFERAFAEVRAIGGR